MRRLNFNTAVRILFASLFIIVIFLIAINFNSILSLKIASNIINIGLLILFMLVLLLFLFFNFMVKSIKNITEYAKLLSEGKLNVDDIEINGKGDLNILSGYINDLKSNLLYMLDQTKSNILVLSESIEKVSNNMDMIFAENEQISSEMQEISSKSQEQLNIVTDTIDKTDDVKTSTDTINKNIKEVKVMAVEADSSAKAGKKNLNEYDKNVGLISHSIEDTNEFIKELKSNASEIGSVVEFIVELNEQLKLLALNASIQAARAGELGKGFNVVAQEITKLSDSTKDGVNKINDIVSKILKGSDNVQNSTEESMKYFENGKGVFLNVEKIFNKIGKENTSVLNQINDIYLEASNINSNIKDTVMLCKKVNDSSIIVSQSTEEVASSVEEELRKFQDINLSAEQLNVELNKIEKLVTKFQLDIKPTAENPKNPLKIAMLIPKLDGVWDIIHFGSLYGKRVLKSKNTTINIIFIDARSKDKYLDIAKNCINEGYDGIVTPGFFEEQLNYVIKKNIPIVTYNMDIKAKNNRIAYVGEDSYKYGVIAGHNMIKQIGGRGKLLILTSNIHFENFKLREQGFRDTVNKNKNIDIVDRLEVSLGDEDVYKAVKDYLNKNKDIDGILNVATGIISLAKAVEELNMSNEVKVIAFYDNTEKIIDYINRDTITCTIGQDPFRQGYDSLIYMYDYLVSGKKPAAKEALTKAKIVDKNKVKHFLG